MTVYAATVRADVPPPPGFKLGRKIEHDSRSWNYRVPATRKAWWWPFCPKPIEHKTAMWEPRIAPLDQGNLGSCTGNAMVACLSAAPTLPTPLSTLTEALAIAIYSMATRVDEFQGTYPPDDTGSSGLAVAKVAKSKGLISSYNHAFSITDVINALQSGPVIVVIAWREDMFTPDAAGFAHYTGPVAGGHEICLFGYEADSGTFHFRNSWGSSWGDNGNFLMSNRDLTVALAQRGDVVAPVWS